MLDFNQVDYVHIDLSEANPSGLAQLLAGRKTRLSTILRDKSQLEAGMRSARTLRTKIYELATDHGLDSGYFVAGTAPGCRTTPARTPPPTRSASSRRSSWRR